MVNLIKLFDDNDFYKRLSNVVLKMKTPLNLQHVNDELFFGRKNINTRNTIIFFNESLIEQYYQQLMQLSVANSMVFVYHNSKELSNVKVLEIADDFLSSRFEAKHCAALLQIAHRSVETELDQENEQVLLSGKIAGYTNHTIETLLNHLTNGVFWKDAHSIYFGCNQQFCDDFGISNPKEIVGKTDDDFLKNKDVKEFVAYDQQVIDSGKSFNKIEKEITLKSGKSWLHIQKFPIRDRSGRTYGILGLYSKRSEQKSLEDHLDTNSIYLQKLLDLSGDLIYFKDEQSKFLKVNKAHAEFLKADNSEDVIGKTDFEFFDTTHARQLFSEEQKVIFDNECVENKLEEVKVDKELVWLNSSKYPVINAHGAVQGLVGISKDITKEIKLNKKLQETNALLDEIVNTSESAILIKDLELNIIDANKAAVALFGVQRVSDLVGKKEVHFVNESMVSAIVKDDVEVIKSAIPLINIKSSFLLSENENSALKISRIPVKNEEGKVFALLVKINY